MYIQCSGVLTFFLGGGGYLPHFVSGCMTMTLTSGSIIYDTQSIRDKISEIVRTVNLL